MMAYDYAPEKFWQAADGLVGDGSIQERLAHAPMILMRLDPGEEDLPEELREEFRAVYGALRRENAATGNEGNIVATTRKLTFEKGAKLARRIFSLYTKLHGGI
jgi:hypothetical protein